MHHRTGGSTDKSHQVVYILRRNSGQGGAERAAERLASQLSKSYTVQRLWAGTSFRGKTIPGLNGPAWWRSWLYTRHIDKLGLIGKDRVVLSLEYGPNCDVYRAGDGIHRLNVRRRYGRKLGWVFNPWHWYAPVLERKCMQSARCIVANSKLIEHLIASEYPDLADRTTTIYNGFDPSVFRISTESNTSIRQRLNLPTDGLMLLLSGHGFVRKGLHHAITLLEILVKQHGLDAFLVVAGKGDPRYVRERSERANIVSRIYYPGAVAQIEHYYQCADFMILPTRHDPFANACLEALACGCPVVTSDQNGAAEIIDGRNGHIMENTYTQAVFEDAAQFIVRFADSRAVVAKSIAHLVEASEAGAYVELIDGLLNTSPTTDGGLQ